MAKKRSANPVTVILWIAVHLAIASLTWRDIAQRPEADIRGPKALWRVVSAMNSLGSALYWLVGRHPRGDVG